MQKLQMMSEKKKIIIAVLILAIVVIGVGVFFFLNKSKGYRLIQVYEVEGDAYIEREEKGLFDAYVNLALQSGDLLGTKQESWARLKMDQDKYMLVEPETLVAMEATGTQKNSRTDIDLRQGAVTVEIQNKLSEKSNYQITTPNSVMAVRGTVFRIKLEWDENGRPITRLTAFEGEISVKKMNEDGSYTEEMLLEKGQEAIIYQEGEEIILKILEGIDFEKLPDQVLEYLIDITTTENRELWVTAAAIQEVLDSRKGESAEGEEREPNDDKSGNEENSTQKPSDSSNQQEAQNQTDSTNTQQQELPAQGNSTQKTPPQQAEESQPGNGVENKEETDKNKDDIQCKVTFMYKGSIFGEQTVTKGAKVQKPVLKPAATGEWDFNFDTQIESDTKIEFK